MTNHRAHSCRGKQGGSLHCRGKSSNDLSRPADGGAPDVLVLCLLRFQARPAQHADVADLADVDPASVRASVRAPHAERARLRPAQRAIPFLKAGVSANDPQPAPPLPPPSSAIRHQPWQWPCLRFLSRRQVGEQPEMTTLRQARAPPGQQAGWPLPGRRQRRPHSPYTSPRRHRPSHPVKKQPRQGMRRHRHHSLCSEQHPPKQLARPPYSPPKLILSL